MKRNSSLCFLVNIGQALFAAPGSTGTRAWLFLASLVPGQRARANRYCTNGERTLYVRAAFRKGPMRELPVVELHKPATVGAVIANSSL